MVVLTVLTLSTVINIGGKNVLNSADALMLEAAGFKWPYGGRWDTPDTRQTGKKIVCTWQGTGWISVGTILGNIEAWYLVIIPTNNGGKRYMALINPVRTDSKQWEFNYVSN